MAAHQWFYQAHGRTLGPISARDLRMLVQTGVVGPETPVSPDGGSRWVTAREVAALFPAASRRTQPPAPPGHVSPPMPVAPPKKRDVQSPSEERRDGAQWLTLAIACAAVVLVTVSFGMALWLGQTSKVATQTAATAHGQARAGSGAESEIDISAAPLSERPTPVRSPADKGRVEAFEASRVQLSTQPAVADARDPEKATAGDAVGLVGRVEPAIVTIRLASGALGSGFLIDRRGTVVTNYHVIEGESGAVVRFGNRREVEVIGFLAVAPGKDLAIVQLAPEVEPYPCLAVAPVLPEKGADVLAFGAPEGLSGSVSQGMVSAIRRGDEVGGILLETTGKDIYADWLRYDADAQWIQTTAPISHGNSGGPLVNMTGQVVGVSTWGHPLGENLNFAVSAIHLADLLAAAKAVRPLAELPAPRPGLKKLAREERERQAEAKRKELADEQRRREALVQQQADRIVRATAIQGELTRLNARKVVLYDELRTVEQEGAALTEQRNGIMQEGMAIGIRLNQLNYRIGQIQAQASAIQTSMATDPVGSAFAQGDLKRQQLFALQLEYSMLMAEGQPLQARYNALDLEARALGSQIIDKSAQQAALLEVLRALESRYAELSRVAK